MMNIYTLWMLLSFMWSPPVVPMSSLEDVEIFTPSFAFMSQGDLYLAQIYRLGVIPQKGEPKAYEKRGRGPKEYSTGMIFSHGDEIWAYDTMTRKMLVFDRQLNYQRDISFRNLETGTNIWASDGETLFHLAMDDGHFAVAAFDDDLNRTEHIRIPGLRQTGLFTPFMGYAGGGWLFAYPDGQNTPDFSIYLFHIPTKTFKTFTHANPDYDSSFANAPLREGYGLALDGGFLDGEKLYVFSQGNIPEALKRNDASLTTRRCHTFDIKSGKAIDVTETQGVFLRTHGPSDVPLLFHDDVGLLTYPEVP